MCLWIDMEVEQSNEESIGILPSPRLATTAPYPLLKASSECNSRIIEIRFQDISSYFLLNMNWLHEGDHFINVWISVFQTIWFSIGKYLYSFILKPVFFDSWRPNTKKVRVLGPLYLPISGQTYFNSKKPFKHGQICTVSNIWSLRWFNFYKNLRVAKSNSNYLLPHLK